MLNIRIHHFFDILRDYGSNKTLEPHEYGHNYHVIGQQIYNNKISEMKLIIDNDDICQGCNKLSEKHCIDTISHRADFKSKEKFNNHIDTRIMDRMGLKQNQNITLKTLLAMSHLYTDAIELIYTGNDIEHTMMRKKNVERGIAMKQDELD